MARIRDLALFSDANLQAYYEFDSGALLTDSKNSNTLTNTNSVSNDTTNQLYGTGAANFGAANTNKYLTRASNLSITGGVMTISLWVKLLAEIGSGTFCLFEQVDDTNNVAYTLNYEYNGGTRRLSFVRNRIGTASATVVQNITLGTTNWANIIVKYDGSDMYMRINGTQYGPTSTSGSGGTDLANSFNLASAQSGGNYSSILLDDVAVFNRSLSNAEELTISALSSPSASVSPSSSRSPSVSPSSSISASQSPSASVSPSSSSSPSSSISPSVSPSSSFSSSVSLSPSVGYSLFSRQALSVLPTTDSDLTTTYTDDEEDRVSEADGIRVGQVGINQYMVHQFKVFVGASNYATIETQLQSSLAPRYSTIYLQIYNRNTLTWDTVTSNNEADEEIDLELVGFVSDLTNYKDSRNIIACRVYQLAL